MHDQSKEFDYLCVDSFIKSIVDARALGTAFELRLIDYLCENHSTILDDLDKKFEGDSQGLRLLVDLLIANQVVEEHNGEIKLSRQFIKALQFRDLLEAKLEFANLVVPDFIDLFTSLINNPDRFNRNARIFDLFGYHRCFDYSIF